MLLIVTKNGQGSWETHSGPLMRAHAYVRTTSFSEEVVS